MMISAPISRATSMGILSLIPPSIKSIPSILIGCNPPGIALEAYMAFASEPDFKTTLSPFLISVATARKGILK